MGYMLYVIGIRKYQPCVAREGKKCIYAHPLSGIVWDSARGLAQFTCPLPTKTSHLINGVLLCFWGTDPGVFDKVRCVTFLFSSSRLFVVGLGFEVSFVEDRGVCVGAWGRGSFVLLCSFLSAFGALVGRATGLCIFRLVIRSLWVLFSCLLLLSYVCVQHCSRGVGSCTVYRRGRVHFQEVVVYWGGGVRRRAFEWYRSTAWLVICTGGRDRNG